MHAREQRGTRRSQKRGKETKRGEGKKEGLSVADAGEVPETRNTHAAPKEVISSRFWGGWEEEVVYIKVSKTKKGKEKK